MVPIAFRGHIDGAGRARCASDYSVVRTSCPQRQRRSDRLGGAAQASSFILPRLLRGAFDVPGRELLLPANPENPGGGERPTKTPKPPKPSSALPPDAKRNPPPRPP